MKNIGTRTAFAAFVTGGLLALGAELRAGGSIDTTGATIQAGSAASPGTVTTDESAALGAVPSVQSLRDPYVDDWMYDELDEGFWSYFYDPDDPDGYLEGPYNFPGLGGPDFHARANLTMPAGQHDYGALTVDPGVVLTIPPGGNIRIAGDAQIEGRIVFAGSGQLHFGSDVTIAGRAGGVTTGIVSSVKNNYTSIFLAGRITVDADDGAEVEFVAPTGSSSYDEEGFTFRSFGHPRAKIRRAKLSNVRFLMAGDLELKECTGDAVGIKTSTTASLAITGGSLSNLSLEVGKDLDVTDAAFPGGFWPFVGGSVHVAGTSELTGSVEFMAYGDIVIDDTVTCSGGGLIATAYRGKVALGSGISTGNLYASGWTGVTVAGTYESTTHTVKAPRGDILFRDGSVLSAPDGATGLEAMTLLAQGAIATTSGTMELKASEFDIRSVTGDLDIDVASMTATTGKIVILSNGAVRLRGSYRAAQEIQVLSRKDAIDVSGATIRTDDAGAGLSGFVRLATYASTATIDASDATLRTGSANGQSGDILLQIAESGEETATAMLKVAATTTRRTKEGVVTVVKGSVASPRRRLSFSGSNRVAAGSRAHHVFLRGKNGRLTGKADSAELVVRQNGARRAAFQLTLHDGGGAAGTTVPLALERAGFRAKGKFRRPK